MVYDKADIGVQVCLWPAQKLQTMTKTCVFFFLVIFNLKVYTDVFGWGSLPDGSPLVTVKWWGWREGGSNTGPDEQDLLGLPPFSFLAPPCGPDSQVQGKWSWPRYSLLLSCQHRSTTYSHPGCHPAGPGCLDKPFPTAKMCL